MNRNTPYIKRGLAFAATAAILIIFSQLLLGRWVCPIYHFTGLPCGGCGILRATDAFLHGRFAAAFSENPLIYLIVFYLLFYGVAYIIGKHQKMNHRFHLFLAAAIFIVFAILRIMVIIW